jgi:hypothetical protein
MADDRTTFKLGFWVEANGTRRTDVTEMTVAIRRCSDGAVLYSWPTSTSPDARGVFYFSAPAAGFPYNEPLYADVTATNGSRVWANNFGLVRV